MKTRITKLTVTPGELFHEMGFEIEIVDEASGEFVEVRSNSEGHPLRIDCSEWPFLRDAIDRMFEEIAENESEGKLKKLLETPAPWDEASEDDEEQALPEWDNGEWEPYDPYSNVLAAVEEQAEPAWDNGEWEPYDPYSNEDSGWIPWNGGECPVSGDKGVLIRLRDGYESLNVLSANHWEWNWFVEYPEGDIIAYKVVD